MKMWKSCGYVCFHPYPCGWMCYVDARDVEHSELLVHWRHIPGNGLFKADFRFYCNIGHKGLYHHYQLVCLSISPSKFSNHHFNKQKIVDIFLVYSQLDQPAFFSSSNLKAVQVQAKLQIFFLTSCEKWNSCSSSQTQTQNQIRL